MDNETKNYMADHLKKMKKPEEKKEEETKQPVEEKKDEEEKDYIETDMDEIMGFYKKIYKKEKGKADDDSMGYSTDSSLSSTSDDESDSDESDSESEDSLSSSSESSDSNKKVNYKRKYNKLKKSSKVQPALEKQIYYPVDPSTYTIDRNFNVHQNLMQEPRLNPVNAVSSSHGKGKGPGSIVLNAGQLPLRR